MQQGEECWFIRLQPDGRLVVKLRDGEQVLQIHGITVPQPLPDSYIETFQQLTRLAKPLYCVIKAGYPDNDIHAEINYFGWRDKTGDIWQDLAILLIEKGIVKVSEDDFPEKEMYLMHARLTK